MASNTLPVLELVNDTLTELPMLKLDPYNEKAPLEIAPCERLSRDGLLALSM